MMYGVPNPRTDKIDVVQRRVNLMAEEVGERGGRQHGPWLQLVLSPLHVLRTAQQGLRS